jgi:hypothetical protein
MDLRWSMLRNLASLPIAGVAGVIFQTAAAQATSNGSASIARRRQRLAVRRS